MGSSCNKEVYSMSFAKYLMGFTCALIATTALTVGVSSAYAKTVYVAAKASGKGTGSVSAPFSTISAAIKSGLQPGDVVLVRPGVYPETVTIPKTASGLPGRDVVFRSEVPKAAKIQAKNYGFFVSANYITIDGFDISGASRSGISGDSVHHITVKNNVSHSNGTAGIYFGKSDFLLIEGNVTHGNAANGVTSGISVHVPQNVSGDMTTKKHRIIVRNNISYNNLTINAGHTDGNGIIFDDFLVRNNYPKPLKPYSFPGLIENNLVYNNGGSGIRVYASNNITVRNNTSYHNSRDPKRTGSTWRGELQNSSASNNVWVNNIAVANLSHSKEASAISDVYHKDWGVNKNVVWLNNITFNGKRGDKAIGAGSGTVPSSENMLGVDPMFMDAPSNFRLKAGSPALDAGTLKFGSSVTAIGGTPRVVKTIDIGAYEAGGTGKPVKDDPDVVKPTKPFPVKNCSVTATTADSARQKFLKSCGGARWADCDKLKNGQFICSSKKME